MSSPICDCVVEGYDASQNNLSHSGWASGFFKCAWGQPVSLPQLMLSILLSLPAILVSLFLFLSERNYLARRDHLSCSCAIVRRVMEMPQSQNDLCYISLPCSQGREANFKCKATHKCIRSFSVTQARTYARTHTLVPFFQDKTLVISTNAISSPF